MSQRRTPTNPLLVSDQSRNVRADMSLRCNVADASVIVGDCTRSGAESRKSNSRIISKSTSNNVDCKSSFELPDIVLRLSDIPFIFPDACQFTCFFVLRNHDLAWGPIYY